MAKPRILISTDAGGSDPDDDQSLVHAFLYADQFKLEGLVSTPTNYPGRVSNILKAVDTYAQDYAKLKTWSSDYPTPEYLKSIVTQGKITPQPEQGWSSPTAGSKAIIQAAHESSEPLWVLCWGAMTDLAQALHDDPSIASKIKVYSSNGWNGTQDPHSREYIMENFKNLWWIESKSTHRGIWVDENGGGNNDWRMSDADGHGALGEYFQNVRPWGLKLGDTPSLLFALKNKSADPSVDSWGGTFVKNGHGPNFWTDNPSPSLKVGPYNGAETIQKHQDAIYKEFAQLLDRAKAPKSGTPSNSDDPVNANDDSASTALGKLIKISVLGNDQAPDGGLKVAAFDATTAKGGKVVLNSDGTLSYTPKAGYAGTDVFGYTAKDADGDTDRASVTVKMAGSSPGTPSNSDDPVNANNDGVNTAQGKLVKVNVLGNDQAPDGGLKVAAFDATTAKGGKIALNDDGTLSYTPKAGYIGTDTFGYTAKDTDGDTDRASVTVKVAGSTPSKPAPPDNGSSKSVKAGDDFYKVDAGEPFYFNPKYMLMNDKAGDGGLKVVSIAKKSDAGFDVTWNGKNTAIYRLKDGFTGNDQIDYVIKDKDGSTDTGTLMITVGKGSPGGSKPTAPSKPDNPHQPGGEKDLVTDNLREVKENDTYYFNAKYLTWNGKGPDGNLKVVDIDDRSAKGVDIKWSKDGTVIYTAKPGWEGVDNFDFTVQDNKGHRDSATVFMQVGDADGQAAMKAHQQQWPSETMALQASSTAQNETADHTWHPNDHLLT